MCWEFLSSSLFFVFPLLVATFQNLSLWICLVCDFGRRVLLFWCWLVLSVVNTEVAVRRGKPLCTGLFLAPLCNLLPSGKSRVHPFYCLLVSISWCCEKLDGLARVVDFPGLVVLLLFSVIIVILIRSMFTLICAFRINDWKPFVTLEKLWVLWNKLVKLIFELNREILSR